MRQSSLENPCNKIGRASQDRIPRLPIDHEMHDLARIFGTIAPTTCLPETRTQLPIVMCSTSLEVERRHQLATTVKGHKSTGGHRPNHPYPTAHVHGTTSVLPSRLFLCRGVANLPRQLSWQTTKENKNVRRRRQELSSQRLRTKSPRLR